MTKAAKTIVFIIIASLIAASAAGVALAGSANAKTDVKVKAKVEVKIKAPKIVTIKFNANGGTVKTASKKVTKGSTYGTLPVPSRKDYSFQGWYTEKYGGSRIYAEKTVSIAKAKTYYARWKVHTEKAGPIKPGTKAPIAKDGKVNINYANEEDLEKIPGVGPALAKKITAYRKDHGNFTKPEDLKNVSGIGSKTYEKMKQKIMV
jgi:comEA protein